MFPSTLHRLMLATAAPVVPLLPEELIFLPASPLPFPRRSPKYRSSFALASTTLLAVLALGCANDLTQPHSEPVRHSADAVVVNQRTHVVDDETLFGTCTGEMFSVTGFIHEKNAVTETATGIIHQALTFTFHLVATSPTTGEAFLIQSVATATFPDVRDLSEGTGQIITLYVTKGSAPNEIPFRFKYHLTYNANGTITSSFSDFESICS